LKLPYLEANMAAKTTLKKHQLFALQGQRHTAYGLFGGMHANQRP
jgi:hypothetical protein